MIGFYFPVPVVEVGLGLVLVTVYVTCRIFGYPKK